VTPRAWPPSASTARASSSKRPAPTLEPESFVGSFMGSISFEPLEGALETLAGLRARGIELAVVSNWDVGLAEHLERIGAAALFTAVVTSARPARPSPTGGLPARP